LIPFWGEGGAVMNGGRQAAGPDATWANVGGPWARTAAFPPNLACSEARLAYGWLE